MTQPGPAEAETPLPGLRRLARLRQWARTVLGFETILPRIGPSLLVVLLFVALAWLDLPQALPGWAQAGFVAVFAVAALLLLIAGLWRWRLPSRDAADRRLEQDSAMRHLPLRALADRPATGSEALWALHLADAREKLNRLRLRGPRPVAAVADPRALRALVLLLLAVGLGVAGREAPSRLAAALSPSLAVGPMAPSTQIQAWVTPPAYTGLAPQFLQPGEAVAVPEGSSVTANVTGNTARPSLVQGSATADFTQLDASSYQITAPLAEGRLVIARSGHELASWAVTLQPDIAPVVRFPEPPGLADRRSAGQIRLPWEVSHAYGVSALRAELTLKPRPDAPPIVVNIPLPGAQPKSAHGARLADLLAHPWAGLAVTARLIATDAAGHVGTSAPAEFTLPERRFNNPVARALIGIRRQLSVAPGDTEDAAQALDALAADNEIWADELGAFLNLTAAITLLRDNPPGSVTPQAQSRLWELALHLEEGAPDRTERALEAARRALDDALRQDADKQSPSRPEAPAGQKPDQEQQRDQQKDQQQAGQPPKPDAAPPAARDPELDRRAEALQKALRDRLEALSQQARRDPDSETYNPDAHPKDTRELQALTQKLRDALKQGDRDAARKDMAELEKKLQALSGSRADRTQSNEERQKRAEQRKRGRQQLSVVQDMIQREGQLLDHAQFRPLAADPARPDQEADHAEQSQTAQREADRRIQLALRRAVGELMGEAADLTDKVPPHLGEADGAMRDSAQDLALGRDGAAAAEDQRAIAALQEGGRELRQQMAQKFGRSQQARSGQNGDQAGDEPGDDEDGIAMTDGDDDRDGDGTGIGEGYGPGDPRQYSPGQNGRPGEFRKRLGQRDGQPRDPLGRPQGQGTNGSLDDGDVVVPEQMEQARTRELQDELRRRAGELTRPRDELDYIERLLKQF